MHLSRKLFIPTFLALLAVISACGPIASDDPQASTPASAVAEVSSSAAASPSSAPSASASPSASAAPTSTVAPSAPAASATAEASVAATAESGASGSPLAATGSYTDVLDARYTQDGDGNAIPDFMEVEFGADPNKDDCASSACPDVPEGVDFAANTNILLLFDASGSMAADLGGVRKIDAAKDAVGRYMRIASKGAQVGLLVYGHKGNNQESGKAESCVSPEILAPIGQVNEGNVQDLIGKFEPTGWTPIGGALEKAQEAFSATQGGEGQVNKIIIISDGIETCEGDPVGVARRLHEEGLNVQVDVIGFDLQAEADRQQMQQIADAGGGFFFDAKTQADFDKYLNDQLQAVYDGRKAFLCLLNSSVHMSTCDQQLYLKANRALWDEINTSTDPTKADALKALFDEVDRRYNARQQQRNELASRLSDLQTQVQELEKELRDTTQAQP